MVLLSSCGDLPRFGIGKSGLEISKAAVGLRVAPFGLDEEQRLPSLNDDEIYLATV